MPSGEAGLEVQLVPKPSINEVRRALRQLDASDPRRAEIKAALKAANKRAADIIALTAQSKAQALGGVHAAAAGQIKGKAVEKGVRISVTNSKKVPFAVVALWGAKRRTGWNAGNEAPNLPPWVGNTWEVGKAGQGPYALNDAIAEKRGEVLEQWARAIEGVARQAGFT